MDNTKVFIILIGESTKNLYKYVRWEVDLAIKREIPIIVVNLNKKRRRDNNLCPALLRDELAIHVSFNQKIITHALNKWPKRVQELRNGGKSGAYHYKEETYKRLGL